MDELTSLYIIRVFVLAVTLIATITDLKWGRIYNKLTFPAMMLGWVLNALLFGAEGLGNSLLATFIGIMLYFPAGAIGFVGMGDVKIMGAIGSICGTNFVISVFLYASALGLPHAILIQYLNYGGKSIPMLLASYTSGAYKQKTIHKENASNTNNRKYRFLIGIDIFIGTILACFHSFSIF